MNYNILDYSSISKVSKSDDSMINKERYNTDYINILHNSNPVDIRKNKRFSDTDFLSEFYKDEKIDSPEVRRSSITSESVIKLKNACDKNNNTITNKINNKFGKSISNNYEIKKVAKLSNNIVNRLQSNTKNDVSNSINTYSSSDSDSDSKDSTENNNVRIQKENSNQTMAQITPINQILLNKINENKRKSSAIRRSSMSNNKLKHTQRKSLLHPNDLQNYVTIAEKETEYGKFMKYLKFLDIILTFLVTGNIVLSLIDNEIYYSESNLFVLDFLKKSNSTLSNAEVFDYMATRIITLHENLLRFINCIVVICVLFAIYIHYFMKLRILRSDKKASENEGLCKSGLAKFMVIEMLICVFVYPPFMNHVVHGIMLGQAYAYSINSIISTITTLKSYIILRMYTYFSQWTIDTAKSICLKHNVVPGINFAIKAEFKKRPYIVLALSSIVLIVIFSIVVRNFEYYIGDSFQENKLRQLSNAIWLIFVTMTTVGYGDIYLYSHWGRFIGVISCVFGLLLVSLIVVSLAIISEFTIEENKAYSILIKINAAINANNKAKNVIINILRLRRMLIEKDKFKLSERFIMITQLKQNISAFKRISKIANSYSLPIDEMLKHLEKKLKEDVHTLGKNIQKISNTEKTFKSISNNQKEASEKMKVILKRQEKIGRFLVEFNNRNFKDNYLKAKLSSSQIDNSKDVSVLSEINNQKNISDVGKYRLTNKDDNQEEDNFSDEYSHSNKILNLIKMQTDDDFS